MAFRNGYLEKAEARQDFRKSLYCTTALTVGDGVVAWDVTEDDDLEEDEPVETESS